MYLEFVKDIFCINDNICVECSKVQYRGTLLKISSDLIALRTVNGIVVIKDIDITNIYSVEPNSGYIKNADINKDKKFDLHNDSSIDANASEKSSNSTMNDTVVDDLTKSSDRDSITNELNENFKIEERSLKKNEIDVSRASVNKEEYNNDNVFEIQKPSVKVVGFIDLSKINDSQKKNGESPVSSKKNIKRISVEQNSEKLSSEHNKINSNLMDAGNSAHMERYINSMIQAGHSIEAIKKIDEILSHGNKCSGKFKSSLLLKRAQIYSALSNYDMAKTSYIELINYNESIKSPANNLSHLYTELARLQNLTKDNRNVVLVTLKKALKYNPNNNYASTLFEQISSVRIDQHSSIDSEHDELILDSEEMSTSISKMIDIDIKEHIFTNELILNNGGVSTPTIARTIYEEAKRTRDVDLSERYPVYLEAAKAYSVLPVGSYDMQEYLESVAYYAILKGNSLFVKFKKLLFDGKSDYTLLMHIKDSACSYYIESLNLLSNIEGEHLLSILGNYLKMNIALINLRKGVAPNISGQFKKVFFDCVSSSDPNLNLIAWTTILSVGTASAKAWNKLTRIKGGTSGLYGILERQETRQKIYSILNRINDTPINTELLPGEFLKKSFANRNERNKKFRAILSDILKSEFDMHLLNRLDERWRIILDFLDLLSETDQESQKVGDKILRNLLPYFTRQSQIERTNLLYQAQRDLELQISFINDNTTYYGRTFFFPLFTKWREIIQNKLDDKISKTLPALQVVPDPPYLVKDEENLYVNLIIKNIGESTAEGYSMKVTLKSPEKGLKINGKNSYENDIPVSSRIDKKMNLPFNFSDCTFIEVTIDISPIYQGEYISSQTYCFTVELEEENYLTEEDIMWKDGPKMSGVLFKGRQDIIDKLSRHYISVERDKPYVLYGLTRTGKSSILLNLSRELKDKTLKKDGVTYRILPYEWDLSEASGYGNAKDMWQYLLYDSLYEEICSQLGSCETRDLTISEFPRAKDFKTILEFLKKKKVYPIFFVDEFSHIKVLLDNHIVNSSFLHTLRQYTFEGLASFIYAGTYDIKELVKDPKYAITGQLVNTVEEQINEIDSRSAEELMNVMGDKLIFSDEAIKQIHVLSGDVPYFIQIICKYCGYFAVEKKRKHIGYPELESVVRILTGEQEGTKDSLVKVLPKSIFQNNLYSPQDKKEVHALISSICYLNNMETPKSVSITELQELWNKNGIEAFRPKLAESISLLLERKVLIATEDEMIPVYRIPVDLFRRWWKIHYPDIKLDITKIQ